MDAKLAELRRTHGAELRIMREEALYMDQKAQDYEEQISLVQTQLLDEVERSKQVPCPGITCILLVKTFFVMLR